MREKRLTQMKFRKGSMKIAPWALPSLNHTDSEVCAAEVAEEGVIDRGGEHLRYQLIRVLLRETAHD